MTTNGLLVASLLSWIHVLVLCTLLLGMETVVVAAIGWVRHLSWQVRASALVPLVASIGTGIATLLIHNLYVYWLPPDFAVQDNQYSPVSQGTVHAVLSGVTRGLREATVLGWLAIIGTGIVLALGLVGLRRLLVGQRQPAPSRPATQ